MLKKLAAIILIFCLFFTLGYIWQKPEEGGAMLLLNAESYEIRMKQDLLCLMMAYPEYVKDVERAENGKVYLILKSGKKLLYDDQTAKNAETKVAYPDLQDMLEQPYPLTPIDRLMDKDYDPGRGRVYELLNEVYGGSQREVEGNLTGVKAGNQYYQFNQNNRAAEALKAAMEELAALARQRPDIRSCLYPGSGTFNYRTIAGTNRLSPHSYGIAIDLARDKRDYWKWASREQGQSRLAQYPKEIPEVLEKYNFVWGGKWGHFDILHFEYRPEIIIKARYFGSSQGAAGLWHSGAPHDEQTRGFIEKINKAL